MTSIDNKDISTSELKRLLHNDNARRYNKVIWIATKLVYKDILKYGGIIYGGAVRDYLVRKYGVNSYYSYCKENKYDANEGYNSPNIHLESYLDRNKLPYDIDVFITKKNFDELIKNIGPKFNMQKRHKSKINTYFFQSYELFKEAIIHEKWTMQSVSFANDFILKILLGFSGKSSLFKICVDFIIIKDEYIEHDEYVNKGILWPPFGKPDFDINLLTFTSGNNLDITCLPYLEQLYAHTHEHTHEHTPRTDTKTILDSVYSNIKNKRACPIL